MPSDCREKYSTSKEFLRKLRKSLRNGEKGIEEFLDMFDECGRSMLGRLLNEEISVAIDLWATSYEEARNGHGGILRPEQLSNFREIRSNTYEVFFTILAKLEAGISNELPVNDVKDLPTSFLNSPSAGINSSKNAVHGADIEAGRDLHIGDNIIYLDIGRIVVEGRASTFSEILDELLKGKHQKVREDTIKYSVDDILWKEVQDSIGNTNEDAKATLARYMDDQLNPDPKHLEEAKAMVVQITRNIDDSLWKAATGSNTRLSYEQYLTSKDLAQGEKRYADEASRRYDTIWWNEIRKEERVEGLLDYLKREQSFLTIFKGYEAEAASKLEDILWRRIQNGLDQSNAALEKAIDEYLVVALKPQPKRQAEVKLYKEFLEALNERAQNRVRRLRLLLERKLPAPLLRRVETAMAEANETVKRGEMVRLRLENVLVFLLAVALTIHYAMRWSKGVFSQVEGIALLLFVMVALYYAYLRYRARRAL